MQDPKVGGAARPRYPPPHSGRAGPRGLAKSGARVDRVASQSRRKCPIIELCRARLAQVGYIALLRACNVLSERYIPTEKRHFLRARASTVTESAHILQGSGRARGWDRSRCGRSPWFGPPCAPVRLPALPHACPRSPPLCSLSISSGSCRAPRARSARLPGLIVSPSQCLVSLNASPAGRPAWP